ncbi:PE family protein [Mycobacterium kansasii]
MLFITVPVVAAQSATEAAGAAVTGSMLAGAAPAMGAVVPMGGEEVSAMFAQAIATHAAEFLAATGWGVAQRGLFAGQVGTSAGVYTASNALNASSLTL